jgi:AcrR family transcriptional regulator
VGRSAGLTPERVVAVAAELADQHGLGSLTLAQVAGRLGVKLPSLYNHVDGLTGLQRAIAALALAELRTALAEAAIGRAGDDAVHAVADAYRAYVLAYPGRYATIVRAPSPTDDTLQALSQSLVDVVVTVLAPYGLGDDDAIHAVRGLRSLAHGFASIEASGGFGIALDRDESFRRLVSAYVAGLRQMDGGKAGAKGS